jgi:hypothetical protein
LQTPPQFACPIGHKHIPKGEQLKPIGQAPSKAPQLDPQPSDPQLFPTQLFAQVQSPSASQVNPGKHSPHFPPQPSDPQDFVPHEGAQQAPETGSQN